MHSVTRIIVAIPMQNVMISPCCCVTSGPVLVKETIAEPETAVKPQEQVLRRTKTARAVDL